MKTFTIRRLSFFLTLSLFLNFLSAQNDKKNEVDSIYSVIYFGATSCYYCNVGKNITNISKMLNEIKDKYKDLHLKTIIVSLDEDLTEGLKFIEKYEKKWDEVAVGSFYKNELALNYLNKTKIPGVPHLVVVKHVTKKDKYNIPVPLRDEILVDLVGGDEIDKWLQENYSFRK